MTIKIKDGKSRTDLAQPVSIITDATSGDALVLQHHRKTFLRIAANDVKALAEKVLKAQRAATPPHKLEDTGQEGNGCRA